MSVKKAMYQFLLHHGGIAGLVQSRIYAAGEQPKEVLFPYITFFRTSRNPQRSLRDRTSGLARARYQIDIWARRELDVDRINSAINDAIDNFRGDFGSAVHSVWVASAFVEDDEETIEDARDGTERPIFHGRLDVTIWHAQDEIPVGG